MDFNSKIDIIGEDYELEVLQKGLTSANIKSNLELKEREKTTHNNGYKT